MAGELPVEGLAGPAVEALRVGVEQVEVRLAVRLEPAHRGRILHPCGLHHPAARASRRLAAVGGALVTVELQDRDPAEVGQPRDLVERRIHEDPDQLRLALERGADLLPRGRVARARALRIEDRAHGPGSELGREQGILRVRDTADLDLGHLNHGKRGYTPATWAPTTWRTSGTLARARTPSGSWTTGARTGRATTRRSGRPGSGPLRACAPSSAGSWRQTT